MPTGGGKSLCYQVPALCLEGTAIVVSPLIALMKDQVDTLQKKGISAAFINSTLQQDEIQFIFQNAQRGNYKLLYIAPERLESRNFIEFLLSLKISFLAVDEAHCISEWGHDFRPAYLNIAKSLSFLPKLPIIALTATATQEVQDDIVKILNLNKPAKFLKGFDRPNLSYKTIVTKNKIVEIEKILNNSKSGSNIIYCGSRKKVETISQALKQLKIPNEIYHGGLPASYRKYVQEAFIEDRCKTIVATNAFGMGIDKSDVRNVIHTDLTLTLEAYYQEAGRAGRDGKESNCYVVYSDSDRKLQEFFISITFPSKKDIIQVYKTLVNLDLKDVTIDEYYKEIFASPAYIANECNLATTLVEGVLSILEKYDVIKSVSGLKNASIKFVASRDRLMEFYNLTDNSKKNILEALMRTVGTEAYHKYVELDILTMKRRHNINEEKLLETIKILEYYGIVEYRADGESTGWSVKVDENTRNNLPVDFVEMEKRKKRAVAKLNLVEEYVRTSSCKRDFILFYFNDISEHKNCGKCSSCLDANKNNQKSESKFEYISSLLIQTILEFGQSYGKTVISSILKGATIDKMNPVELRKSSVYGMLKDISLSEIKKNIDEMIALGILTQEGNKYPILKISEKGKSAYNSIFNQFSDHSKQKSNNQNSLDDSIYFDEQVLAIPQDIQIVITNLQNKSDLNSEANKLGITIGELSNKICSAIESGCQIDKNIFIDDKSYSIILAKLKKKPNILLKQLRQVEGLDLDFAILRIALSFARIEIKK